jgi:hypothetical protein
MRERVYAGFDGEGVTTGGEHRYVLLCMADTAGNRRVLRPRQGDDDLRTWQMLNFLFFNGLRKSCWFFAGNYDWTMILKDLVKSESGRRVLHRIYHSDVNDDGSERDAMEPVIWRQWGFVRLQGTMKLTHYGKKELTVSFQDAFKCFGGGSFVKNLKDWSVGTESQVEQVAEMKEKRSFFTSADDEVTEYCLMEVSLLAEMARKVTSTFGDIGIRPRGGTWYSTGTAAKAVMRTNGVQDYRGPDRYGGAPGEYQDLILRAFIGGRFENAETGLFEVLYLEDIKSAYPWVIRGLPCLSHGTWTRGAAPVTGAVNIGHVTWSYTGTGRARWCPFPYRDDKGGIWYPENGSGWYHESEIISAHKMRGFMIRDHEWISFTPSCSHKPFLWIQDLYDLRKEWGSDGRGFSLKITLNSVYGTLVDSVSPNSKVASILWGGMVTAGCRARILDELAVRGDDIVTIATDGIMSKMLSPRARESSVLGDLNYEGSIENALIIQPGLYLADGRDPKKRQRNRGHNWNDIKAMEADIRQAWDTDGFGAELEYRRSRFIPAKLALTRKDPVREYGRWSDDQSVRLSFVSPRRAPSADTGRARRTWPRMPRGFLGRDSAPYSRKLSAVAHRDMIAERDLDEAQPLDAAPRGRPRRGRTVAVTAR